MTAFLFNEDHPDMGSIFGPKCAAPIIKVIENTPSAPALRLLRGGLLHHRYCYELTEIELSTKDDRVGKLGVSSSSQSYSPSKDRLMSIICDLAETMAECGSSMPVEQIQNMLGKMNVWVVAIPDLTPDLRSQCEQALQAFGPFLGWVEVNWDNPIHHDLFAESLFRDMFVSGQGLYCQTDWPVGSIDWEDDEAMAAAYQSKNTAVLLSPEQFEAQAPPMPSMGTIDERGRLSVSRMVGEEPHHREKVGRQLAGASSAAVGGFVNFKTTKPDGGLEFTVPEQKLTAYLLNLDHPKGGAKAQFFKDKLDISKEDWRYLADQFCQAGQHAELYRLDVTGYGVMHGALALITGRNGQCAVVETGWKLGEDGPAQFITAYPGDETEAAYLEPVVGRVPSLDCLPPQRWQQIHELAHSEGMKRAEAKQPTPMVLEKYGTIWEGMCGFGWVFLPDARKPFPKWALENKLGYPSRPGVHISSKVITQSIDKNFSYAQGYAEVLKANGIDCEAQSRLD
ncbi:DUF6883 domain-containing protein [Sphingorhabdus sp. EL138]|uniref:DUF6883 domain-containing protein n=1 Tax=Sphingorhabdus sp. EL138 TaxID=2073156 RepID=UPI000D685893|nr:DUF6883 domain-containing protein [Sphingorhabdus sp. EL138]